MALSTDNAGSASEKARKLAAAQNETFIREVDDALREDELASFLKRFGLPLLAVICLGLAAFGGYLYWGHSQKKAADERGEQYVQALDQLEANNLQGAYDKIAPVAAADGTTSAASAKLLRAGIALEQKRPDEAAKIYDAVATDKTVPQPMRDLAQVRYVSVRFDKLKPEDVVNRLKPLAVPESAWFGVAGELLGMAYIEQDRKDLAGPLFAKMARDTDLPDSLRGRARQLAGVLGVDSLDNIVGENGVGSGAKNTQAN